MIFLDTSSRIEILNGNQSLKNVFNNFDGETYAITTPTIFELYHGIYKLKILKHKISKQKYNILYNDLEGFLTQLTIISLNEKAAKYAVELHLQLKAKGQEIEVFDCLIVAIILTNNFHIIIIKNKEHFERIENLKVYSF